MGNEAIIMNITGSIVWFVIYLAIAGISIAYLISSIKKRRVKNVKTRASKVGNETKTS